MSVNSPLFNPHNSHIITSSLQDNTIQIWFVRKPYLNKIKCEDIPNHIMWEKNGNLLYLLILIKLKIQ